MRAGVCRGGEGGRWAEGSVLVRNDMTVSNNENTELAECEKHDR